MGELVQHIVMADREKFLYISFDGRTITYIEKLLKGTYNENALMQHGSGAN